MPRGSLSPAAIDDIQAILLWTEEQFGGAARTRYKLLLRQAIKEIARNPELSSSVPYPELGPQTRIYHIQHSRNRIAPAHRVKNPRHFLVYRTTGTGRVVISRVLHDSMELSRHDLEN